MSSSVMLLPVAPVAFATPAPVTPVTVALDTTEYEFYFRDEVLRQVSDDGSKDLWEVQDRWFDEKSRAWLRDQLLASPFLGGISIWQKTVNHCEQLASMVSAAANVGENENGSVEKWHQLRRDARGFNQAMQTVMQDDDFWAILITSVFSKYWFHEWVEVPLLRMFWDFTLRWSGEEKKEELATSTLEKECVDTLSRVAAFFCTDFPKTIRNEFLRLRQEWHASSCTGSMRRHLPTLKWQFSVAMRREREMATRQQLGQLHMGLSKHEQAWRITNYHDGGYHSGVYRSSFLQRDLAQATVELLLPYAMTASSAVCGFVHDNGADNVLPRQAARQWYGAYWHEKMRINRFFRALSGSGLHSTYREPVILEYGSWNSILGCREVTGVRRFFPRINTAVAAAAAAPVANGSMENIIRVSIKREATDAAIRCTEQASPPPANPTKVLKVASSAPKVLTVTQWAKMLKKVNRKR